MMMMMMRNIKCFTIKPKTFPMHSTVREAGQLVDNIPYTASRGTEFGFNTRYRSMSKCKLVSLNHLKRLKSIPIQSNTIQSVGAVYLRVS